MKRMEISLELSAPMMRESAPVNAMTFSSPDAFFAATFVMVCRLHSAKAPQTGGLPNEIPRPDRALPEELTWD
jgi:hypothetical protein